MYLELQKRTRLGSIQAKFPLNRWDVRRGTVKQAIDYCKKLDTRVEGPWEAGVHPTLRGARQGAGAPAGNKHATKLKLVAEAVKKGLNPREVAEIAPDIFVRHYKGLDALHAALLSKHPRKYKTKVFVFWGTPDAGKTFTAVKMAEEGYPQEEIYIYDKLSQEEGREWWEAYRGQKCVIIEEFEPKMFTPTRFQRLADFLRCLVPYKGGSIDFMAETLILTSNYDPREWFPGAKYPYAIFRRIEKCFKMCIVVDKNGKPRHNPECPERLLYYAMEDKLETGGDHDQTLLNLCKGIHAVVQDDGLELQTEENILEADPDDEQIQEQLLSLE